MLHETIITCPSCNVEFPLTETLAQPFINAERAKIQREAQERATALNKHEQDLVQRQRRWTTCSRSWMFARARSTPLSNTSSMLSAKC